MILMVLQKLTKFKFNLYIRCLELNMYTKVNSSPTRIRLVCRGLLRVLGDSAYPRVSTGSVSLILLHM